MSKIDLSKAKIGDKFRDRGGRLHELIYVLKEDCRFRYLLVNEQKDVVDDYKVGGSYLNDDISNLDLVEQVLDEPLDTRERDIRTNYEMGNVVKVAKEEKQEHKRRQEVVELAEKLLIRNLKDLAEYSYYAAFKDAETFVKLKHKYLKEGKLC